MPEALVQRWVLMAMSIETVMNAAGTGVHQNIAHFTRIATGPNTGSLEAARNACQAQINGAGHMNTVFFTFQETVL